MLKRNRRRPRLKITDDGSGVVIHVGARLLADLADQMGLTSGLSVAMAPSSVVVDTTAVGCWSMSR